MTKIDTCIRAAWVVSAVAAAAFFALVPFVHADMVLNNPLNSNFSSIPNFIAGALKVMVMIALPIISVFIVYSGFLFVAAQGNSEKLSQARNNLLYVVIG